MALPSTTEAVLGPAHLVGLSDELVFQSPQDRLLPTDFLVHPIDLEPVPDPLFRASGELLNQPVGPGVGNALLETGDSGLGVGDALFDAGETGDVGVTGGIDAADTTAEVLALSF